ncbi:MAG TPA: paraquat-inducible protein A [Verrucomicrobiae bacterium]|nr:paraquat-inducible protein A [Verrucomicrobiae bacterium]
MHGKLLMNGLLACRNCGLVQRFAFPPRGHEIECSRCGEVLLRGRPFSRARTAAFALAALFLYVPANIYPVMIMQYLGRETENTVWGGIRALYQDGMWGVAAVVFLASMVVPVLKLMGLMFLVVNRNPRWRRFRGGVHRWIGWLGPWAMLDVFLLAIMVALIRFGTFATVVPGPGVVAFTAVVALTLLASASFDPQLIWEEESHEHGARVIA